MSIDRELIRRGVIVPTFKPKQNNILTHVFKGRYYLNYSKARAKARSLNLQGASEWKKYCYLNDTLPVYRIHLHQVMGYLLVILKCV